MSRPEQNQRAAISSTPRASGLVTDREGFRPVALPALAAAVHVSASAAKEAARKMPLVGSSPASSTRMRPSSEANLS